MSGSEETDWNAMGRMNPTVGSMMAAGVPMTQENYLDAQFDGDVPEELNQEAHMGLPAGLQDFQGVGLSELPAGPMPIAMGQPGQGPKVAPLGQAVPETQSTARPVPSQISPGGHEATSPLVQNEVPTPSGQFRQQSWKPPQTKQGG